MPDNVTTDTIRFDRRDPATTVGAPLVSEGGSPMARWFVVMAAVTGFLAVAAGTFKSHVLAGGVSDELVQSFDIGVHYQMYHVPALLASAWLVGRRPGLLATSVGWTFVAGIVLFSGSLYAYAVSAQDVFGYGAAVGAMVLMIGWLMLAGAAMMPAASPGVSPTH